MPSTRQIMPIHNQSFKNQRLFKKKERDANEAFMLQNQVYICNYLLKAEQEQSDGYKELLQKYTKTNEAFRLAQTEVADLQAQLNHERKMNKKKNSYLRGKIKTLIEKLDRKTNDSASTRSLIHSCDDPSVSEIEDMDVIMEDENDINRLLIEEMLELKLQIASFQSEADWNKFRLNHLAHERDALLMERYDKTKQSPKAERSNIAPLQKACGDHKQAFQPRKNPNKRSSSLTSKLLSMSFQAKRMGSAA